MKSKFFTLLLLAIFLTACSRAYSTIEPYAPRIPTYDPSVGGNSQTGAPGQSEPQLPAPIDPAPAVQAEVNPTPFLAPTLLVNTPATTPTPDQPKTLPTLRTKEEKYTVQPRDTLFSISSKFGVDMSSIMAANQIANANLLYVGQVLLIPAPSLKSQGSSFKIIPDSELVYGPNTTGFSVKDFVNARHGYLAQYRQTVDDVDYSGAEIVERIAREYSVNPRLLLAVLEYQSGWVTRSNPPDNRLNFPIGRMETYRKGLYNQLAYAADNLNRGYYLWRVNGISSWIMTDGSVAPISPYINAGTAGVQQFFALMYDRKGWDQAVSEQGLYAVYNNFFGNPFHYAYEPVIPPDLTQPKMQLPFQPGVVWSFTGGPHGGWGEGSAWAALDFGPPEEGGGCRKSDAWVVAVADGVITRSEFGEVVQDLDGDGNEHTGWSVLYMHIGSDGRVPVGSQLKAGDRIGHPSCEGGISNGTHTHIARRYNGEWIPADGPIPFDLDGWISGGEGVEYYGTLSRNGQILEAWDTKTENNQISR